MTDDDLRLRNDLYCVEWGVKLYSLPTTTDDDDVQGLSTLATSRASRERVEER